MCSASIVLWRFRPYQGLLTVGDLVIYFQAVQRASGFLEGLGWSVSNLYESNLFLTTLDEFLGIQSRLPKVGTSEDLSSTDQAGD